MLILYYLLLVFYFLFRATIQDSTLLYNWRLEGTGTDLQLNSDLSLNGSWNSLSNCFYHANCLE